MEIQWEKPPEAVVLRSRSNGRYIDFALAVASATPPEGSEGWALLPPQASGQPRTEKSAKGMAQGIKRGTVAGFAKGEWDAVADNNGRVWVRYKGPADPQSADAERGPRQPGEGDDDHEPPKDSLAPRIRAWAHDKGIEVSERGRLPRELIDRYFDDTGEPRPPHLRAV